MQHMAIFKCKMCGGTIEFNPGDTVGVCDSCGTKQTLPRLNDEKKTNLYDRANHFRRSNDFDKAMGIYEQILNEDSTDAEAYWSLVLCRYGIEYVEDPATHKRVPTVNRAQYTSIFSDEDYKSALQYADSYQRVIYEDEAKAIDDRRKTAELKARAEADRTEAERQAEKTAKRNRILIIAALVCIALFVVYAAVIEPKIKLKEAMSLLDSGDCESAYALLEELGKTDAVESSKFNRAVTYITSADYASAYALLEEIGKTDEIASNKYDRAMAYLESGDYESAYALLANLQYKDSREKALQILSDHPEYAQVGVIVTFGVYEQNNHDADGKEAIEWQVLAREGSRVLLISKYSLDCQPYNTKRTAVTWENSALRAWLNGIFLDNAFSSSEQAAIVQTTVTADKNPEYDTDPGNATTDKVFLLSIAEAEKYFPSDSARLFEPTAFADANGAYVTIYNNSCCWLRSPGFDRDLAASVDTDGSLDYYGFGVDFDHGAVRPALWLDLEKIGE